MCRCVTSWSDLDLTFDLGQEMLTMVQRTDDLSFVVIWINVWIQEVLKDFFLFARINILGDLEPR